MTLANEGISGRPSTNEDVANKPRRITKSATFNTWRREKQITTDHEVCIKTTSRTKYHDSNEYEKALRLRCTLNSQASIGFVIIFKNLMLGPIVGMKV